MLSGQGAPILSTDWNTPFRHVVDCLFLLYIKTRYQTNLIHQL
jgi:hypothetical protein